MDEQLKRRLVGATVIMSLVVIFVPMLVDKEPVRREDVGESNIPEEPESDLVQREFQTEELVPLGGKNTADSAAASSLGNGATESAGQPSSGQGSNTEEPATVDGGKVSEPQNGGDAASSQGGAEESPVPTEGDVPAVGEDVAPLDGRAPGQGEREAPPDDASLEDLRRGDLKAWVVQVASFSNPKFADNLVDELREKGFAAFMEDVLSNGRIWYRVVVGPEVDKQRTRDLQDAIVKATDDERLRGAIKSYP